jgi:hypothetical protein
MNIEVKWIKEIPKKQIDNFTDRVVYDVAVLTREYTKGTSAFPRLTGELERQEIATPIVGSNKEYGLSAGVKYAGYVWKMKDVSWTNKSTKPQWYYTQFKNDAEKIVNQAVLTAKKEI